MNLEKDVFRYHAAPFISSISVNEFIIQEKLTKPTIDSLLKAKGVDIQEKFNSIKGVESVGLMKYSTDKSSNIMVYLSEKMDGLVVAELIEFPASAPNIGYAEALNYTNIKRMKMLFLFNDIDEVIEVEYQKKSAN